MTEFKLPELGENVHQGDLVRLMVSPGATITEGQPVMELETDKAVVEVPSSVTGTVKDVLVKQGEKIKVGQVIFKVDNGAGGKRVDVQGVSAAPKADATQPPVAQQAPARTSPSMPAKPAQPRPTAAQPTSAVVPSETAELTEFKLPELGENVDQGDLVRLMVSPGAQVSEGQPVMELETDKAVVEVPSSLTGTVKDVLVSQGDKIKVGQVVFTLEPGAISRSSAQQPARADESHE